MAIDIIARGLATSLIGADGKVAAEKMPVVSGTTDLSGFTSIGKLTDATMVEGKTAEEILMMMLYGVVNPTLTTPKLSIALMDENSVPIIGRKSTLKGTIVFDRGAISPAYGTSGYRTGVPISYIINDQTVENSSTTYDFELSIIPTDRWYVLNYGINYKAGEQPLNSIGREYDHAYPAGTINQQLIVTSAYPLFGAQGSEKEFTWFEAEDGSGYLSLFAAETFTEKQTFAVSTAMTVIGVKAFNALTQQWDWLGGEGAAMSLTYFDTTILSGDSLGEATNFIQYTHNSARTGERELRIYVQ